MAPSRPTRSKSKKCVNRILSAAERNDGSRFFSKYLKNAYFGKMKNYRWLGSSGFVFSQLNAS